MVMRLVSLNTLGILDIKVKVSADFQIRILDILVDALIDRKMISDTFYENWYFQRPIHVVPEANSRVWGSP